MNDSKALGTEIKSAVLSKQDKRDLNKVVLAMAEKIRKRNAGKSATARNAGMYSLQDYLGSWGFKVNKVDGFSVPRIK